MCKIALSVLLFLLLGRSVFAQPGTNQLITADFQNATLTQFAEVLETKSSFHFYFNPAETDSLRITLKAVQLTLPAILTQALQNTSFRFTIDNNKHVFITKNFQITTELAEGFIPGRKPREKQDGQPAIALPEPVLANTDKTAVATQENKLYEIGIKTNDLKGEATVAGYLRNIRTGEPIIGASISAPDLKRGILSDQFGYFSLTLPKGQHTLTIKAISIRDTKRQVMLYGDGQLNIELQDQVLTLKQVDISSQRASNVKNVEMGLNKIDIKSIKQVPTVFGEADILRVVLTLPGVQSVGEASTGFNVRGGATDQNLILLNDATIYNPSHFFGFFSAFNPDLVQDVELYKSSIPVKYGGRLSSVLDVNNREGNKKKFTGTAGIGLITSRLNIEGPIDSNKTSFILGGRTTYSNWMLDLLPNEYKNSRANFSDINVGISHQFNEKNNLYLSGYYSTDGFSLNSDTTYGYSNKNASIKWKHNFNNKFFGVFNAGFDRYQYNVNSPANTLNAYDLKFDINQSNFKADFTYYLNPKNTLDFGVSSVYYKMNPGNFQPLGSGSSIIADVVPTEKALESAVYLGDKFDLSEKFSITAGVRYSVYNFLGPKTVYNYAPGLPKTPANRTDSTNYNNNALINTYHGPEVRVAARYSVSDELSVKASFNTLRQYIHLLSNTTAIAPTDVYKLSDPNIRPQYGGQVSLGIYKNFNANTIETSIEGYYKKMQDYLDYKSGANLVLNHNIETDVINTEGKAYGIEFFVKKTTGMINGWVSYAYSRTFLKMDDPTVGTPVNRGAYYPANYDKPHAFNFTGNYRFTHRYSLSLNLTYSTGRPITIPVGKYYYAGSARVFYSDRNASRVPDYFRSDISVNIDGNHKVNQKFHNSVTFGVYNLTGQQNAYSTYFTSENGLINGYKLSIFASAIPFINYNVRF